MTIIAEPGATSFGANIVRLVFNIPNVDDVLDAGFKRIGVERSTDGGLTFVEVTTAASRQVLETGKTDYVFIDDAGDAQYKYRARFYTAKGKASDPGDAIDGAGALLLGVLTVAELKQRYFFGIDITDDAGNPLPDEVFQFYILKAIAWLEHELDIKILPTTIVDEKADYYRADYPEFSIIQLENYPVISVEEFNVDYPSGETVVNFPEEWIRIDKTHGILRVVPTAGTLSEIIIGQGGSFLPAVYSGLSYLPDLFSISYTAGFPEGQIPPNLIDLIGMAASFGPFNLFGDLIAGAGIASKSLSIDGLSQSINTTSSATNSGYGARLIQYGKQIKTELPNVRRFYKGVRLVSV